MALRKKNSLIHAQNGVEVRPHYQNGAHGEPILFHEVKCKYGASESVRTQSLAVKRAKAHSNKLRHKMKTCGLLGI